MKEQMFKDYVSPVVEEIEMEISSVICDSSNVLPELGEWE